MKKRNLVFFVVVLVFVLSSLLLVACQEKLEPNKSKVDIKDVEYETDADGNINGMKYPGQAIKVKYLLSNNSFIELSGDKADEMWITDFEGNVESFAIKDIEKNVKADKKNVNIVGIAANAFADCTSLKSVDLSKINDSVEFDIGNNAFSRCIALESVILPTNIYSSHNNIGTLAFGGDINLKSVKNLEKFPLLGDRAFLYCSSLPSITLSTNTVSIGDSTFMGCTSLASVNMPNKIRDIGENAFMNTALTSIDFTAVPNLHYIADNAFNGAQLTSLVIPDSIQYIGSGAFMNNKLATIDLPFIGSDLPGYNYNDDTFNHTYGNKDVFDSKVEVKSPVDVTVRNTVNIPDSRYFANSAVRNLTINFIEEGEYDIYEDIVPIKTKLTPTKTIPNNTFYDCALLEKIEITGIESIGDGAFAGAVKLDDVSNLLSEELIGIGNNAFAGTAITNVVLPSSLIDMGEHVFYACPAISSIEVKNCFISNEKNPLMGVSFFDYNYAISDWFGADVPEITGFDEFGYPIYDADSPFYTSSPKSTSPNTHDFYPKTLTSIVLNNVKGFNDNFVSGMKSINSVIVNNYVESQMNGIVIGSYAFADTSISDLSTILVDGVTNIGDYAFANTEVSAAIIPSTVKGLGSSLFYGNDTFKSLTINRAAFVQGDSFSYATFNNILTKPLDKLFGAPNKPFMVTEEEYPYYYAGYNMNTYVPKSFDTLIIKDAFDIPNYFATNFVNLNNVEISYIDLTTYDEFNSIGNNAFENTGITDINKMLSGVYSIDRMAFANTNIVDVVLPNTVNYIGEKIFFDIPTFKSLTVENSCTYTITNDGMVTNKSEVLTEPLTYYFGANPLPPMITEDDYPFYYAGTSMNTYIPKSFDTLVIKNASFIPNNFARNMVNLKNATVTWVDLSSYGVDSVLGDYAFDNTGITNVDGVIAGVNVINQYAFASNDIAKVTLGGSLIHVAKDAFNSNILLEELVLDINEAATIENAFSNCNAIKKVTTNNANFGTFVSILPVTYVEEVVISEGVINIPANLFLDMINVTKVDLPNSLLSIEENAFSSCTSLPKTAEGYLIVDNWLVNTYAQSDIVIPNTIVGFANNFTNASKIYYLGTEEQFNAIFNVGSVIGLINVVYNNNFVYNDGVVYVYYKVEDPMLPDTFIESVEVECITNINKSVEILDNVNIAGADRPVTAIGENIYIGSNVINMVIPASVTKINDKITTFSVQEFIYLITQEALDQFKADNTTVFPASPDYTVVADAQQTKHKYNLYKDKAIIATSESYYFDYTNEDPLIKVVGFYLDEAFTMPIKLPYIYRDTDYSTVENEINIYMKYKEFNPTFSDVTDPFVSYTFDVVDATYSSTNHENNSSSVVELKANDDFEVTFSYFVDSEQSCDKLNIYNNGALLYSFSGKNKTGVETIICTANDVIKFTYTKDYSANSYSDMASFTIISIK